MIDVPSELTVTQISNKLKNLVEGEFAYVRVRGEVSGFKLAPSGHAYFSLKDNSSVLAAICWKGTLTKLAIKPKEGADIICIGSITIYPGQSKYQLLVEKVELAGIGALMVMLEKRKAQFAQEGLFAEVHKKLIPFLPQKIGVITSPTGAVIKDILHRIKDRFPSHILLWPVLVQGEKAAEQVAEAINGFNNLQTKPDVLIIARGGGSVEDLWAFNEEIVVRAAFASKIPIISAIGHETDFTLLDFVADLRAPTPTGAAEKAVPVLTNVYATIRNLHSRVEYAINKFFEYKKHKILLLTKSLPNYQTILVNHTQRLDDLAIRFHYSCIRLLEVRKNKINFLGAKLKNPKNIVDVAEQKLSQKTVKLNNIINHLYTGKLQKLNLVSSLLDSYSYKKTLSRGFAIISSKNKTLTSAAEGKPGDKLLAEFHDGKLAVVVDYQKENA